MKKQGIRKKKNVYVENDSYRWVVNWYPKFEGHTLIVPKRHITTFGEETPKELSDREELIAYGANILKKMIPTCGVELFLQTGLGSASSIDHFHWHLVPAMPDDPLRSLDKMGQFYTVEPGKERLLLFPIKIRWSPNQLLKKLSTCTSMRRSKRRV